VVFGHVCIGDKVINVVGLLDVGVKRRLNALVVGDMAIYITYMLCIGLLDDCEFLT